MRRCKRLRWVRGFTIDQLAAQSGLDRSTICRIENAHGNGNVESLAKLAAALGVAASRSATLIDEVA